MNNLIVNLKPIVSNINLPTVIKTASIPNETHESLFIATQVGEILYINKNGIPEDFLDIKQDILKLGSNGGYDERGLLGLAFHPNFNSNGLFYLHYSQANSQGPGALKYNYRPNPCDRNSLNLKWENRTINYDHIDVIEEWKYFNQKRKSKQRTILKLRRPFANHNGVNTLSFSKESNKLIFINGDGGSTYDPFNLSQNNFEIAGKIFEIDVHANSIDNQAIVSRFDELSPIIQSSIDVIGKGVRNASGIEYFRHNNEYIKYFGQVGQGYVESIYSFNNYKPINVRNLRFENNKLINFGWRGYEGNLPTPIINPCTNDSTLNQLIYAFNDEVIKLSSKRLNPLTSYYHIDPRADKFAGTAITGVKAYRGDAILNLQNKIIFCDFVNKKAKQRPIGVLAYTNSIETNPMNDYHEIKINYNFNEPAFFVSLGTNLEQTKIYLGVYNSSNVVDLNKGTVYEIIPDNKQ